MDKRQKTGGEHKSGGGLEHFFSRIAEDFHRFWRPVAAVVVILVAGFLVYQNYAVRRDTHFKATWKALSELPRVHPMMSEEQREEQLRDVIEECRRLLAEQWKTRATPWVLLRLGNAHLKLGEPEAAAVAFDRVKEEYKNHHVYHLALPNLAVSLEQVGDHDEAAGIYEILISEEPDNPFWAVAAGRNYELAGDRDAAINAYRKAVRKAADKEVARHKLEVVDFRVSVLEREGDLLQALPEPLEPLPGPEDIQPDIPTEAPDPEIVPELEDVPDQPLLDAEPPEAEPE